MNVYQVITERILDMLKQGVIPWQKPWQANGKLAVNAITKKKYRGINQMLLSGSPFESNMYVSRLQIEQHGGKVKDKQSPSPVVFYTRIEDKDKDGNAILDEKGQHQTHGIMRYYFVYNVCQVEGIEYDKVDNGGDIVIASADNIVDGMPNRPEIKSDNCKKAYYSPSLDTVNVPEKRFFFKGDEYYSTLFHELGHSTGHESRLNRKTITTHYSFGSKQYAYEELVAEMTAGFLCAKCGIEKTIENSAAYIQSWLKALKDNHKLVIIASGSAQKAVNYITQEAA